ncbi:MULTISPECIES: hypothetical protein [Asticcacaulis]|uniref:hypothetical protein n=1 Tax=Asticcacaulis TaxID=76890 RepID=UPI001AE68494|nr:MULTISPECIES: hypothetical protein [Asticcacaulis]MBP2160260.1 hypothetical protein [Asticcacaulis solisilvae]MDR6801437.1 hypothetical protein [Asticcacaulis sp. BE141]
MALNFPLSISDFFGGLKIQSMSFDLPESLVATGTTGAGEILTADLGARLWTGRPTSAHALWGSRGRFGQDIGPAPGRAVLLHLQYGQAGART